MSFDSSINVEFVQAWKEWQDDLFSTTILFFPRHIGCVLGRCSWCRQMQLGHAHPILAKTGPQSLPPRTKPFGIRQSQVKIHDTNRTWRLRHVSRSSRCCAKRTRRRSFLYFSKTSDCRTRRFGARGEVQFVPRTVIPEEAHISFLGSVPCSGKVLEVLHQSARGQALRVSELEAGKRSRHGLPRRFSQRQAGWHRDGAGAVRMDGRHLGQSPEWLGLRASVHRRWDRTGFFPILRVRCAHSDVRSALIVG